MVGRWAESFAMAPKKCRAIIMLRWRLADLQPKAALASGAARFIGRRCLTRYKSQVWPRPQPFDDGANLGASWMPRMRHVCDMCYDPYRTRVKVSTLRPLGSTPTFGTSSPL